MAFNPFLIRIYDGYAIRHFRTHYFDLNTGNPPPDADHVIAVSTESGGTRFEEFLVRAPDGTEAWFYIPVDAQLHPLPMQPWFFKGVEIADQAKACAYEALREMRGA